MGGQSDILEGGGGGGGWGEAILFDRVNIFPPLAEPEILHFQGQNMCFYLLGPEYFS